MKSANWGPPTNACRTTSLVSEPYVYLYSPVSIILLTTWTCTFKQRYQLNIEYSSIWIGLVGLGWRDKKANWGWNQSTGCWGRSHIQTQCCWCGMYMHFKILQHTEYPTMITIIVVMMTCSALSFLQEIKELQALIDRDKGVEMRDIWKGEMSKAVNELQKEYDNQINQIRLDCESRMESQVRFRSLFRSTLQQL